MFQFRNNQIKELPLADAMSLLGARTEVRRQVRKPLGFANVSQPTDSICTPETPEMNGSCFFPQNSGNSKPSHLNGHRNTDRKMLTQECPYGLRSRLGVEG